MLKILAIINILGSKNVIYIHDEHEFLEKNLHAYTTFMMTVRKTNIKLFINKEV